jgi:hypothetical protein
MGKKTYLELDLLDFLKNTHLEYSTCVFSLAIASVCLQSKFDQNFGQAVGLYALDGLSRYSILVLIMMKIIMCC